MPRRRVLVLLIGLTLAVAGLIGLISAPPATPVPPVLPSLDDLDAAVAAGESVTVDAASRRMLELAGFRLRAAGAVAVVTGRYRCATLHTDRWSLLAGVEYTGRLGIDVPAGEGSMVIVVGDDLPLRLRASEPDGSPVTLLTEPLGQGLGAEHPPADYWMDGGNPLMAPPEAERLTVPAPSSGSRLLSLELGRRAPRVLARLLNYAGDPRGRVCAAPLGDEWFAAGSPAAIDVPLDDPRWLGAGWQGGGDGTSTRAWRAGAGAAVLVPIATRAATRVILTATPTQARRLILGLEVNGIPQPTRVMDDGGGVYTWDVPPGAWLPGTNELLFRVRPARSSTTLLDGAAAEPGMLVRALQLARTP